MNLKVGQCVSPARVSAGNPPTGRGRRDALPYSDASPVQGLQARIARSGNSLPNPLPALRWRGEGEARWQYQAPHYKAGLFFNLAGGAGKGRRTACIASMELMTKNMVR